MGKYKFRDPNTGEVFEDIKRVREIYCRGRRCPECKVQWLNNGKHIPCVDFCKAYPVAAAQYMGYQVIDDKDKNMDKKDGETSARNFASPERMAEIANNALDYIGEIVGGSDLYGVLSSSLGMSNEEILASGFTTLKAYMEEVDDG